MIPVYGLMKEGWPLLKKIQQLFFFELCINRHFVDFLLTGVREAAREFKICRFQRTNSSGRGDPAPTLTVSAYALSRTSPGKRAAFGAPSFDIQIMYNMLVDNFWLVPTGHSGLLAAYLFLSR
jgi:hypothetical protein